MSDSITVVGIDPSLRNWGIATATLNIGDPISMRVTDLKVIQPVLPTGKQVRKNSLDLESAYQIAEATLTAVQGAQAIFVEVPEGSKSARAMASYGICVGILGALRGFGIPFFEVSQREVKMATVGSKLATKKEMIEWGVTKHPEAPWPRHKKGGDLVITEGTAEHGADAIAAIYAGLSSNSFQQVLPFILRTN